LAQDGGEWPASHSGHSTPMEKTQEAEWATDPV